MEQSELIIVSATLKRVRERLAQTREAGSKRLGFQRAEQVVQDMQLELLDELGGNSKSEPRVGPKAP